MRVAKRGQLTSQFSKEEKDRFQKLIQINFILVPSKTGEQITKQVVWGQLSKGMWASGAGMMCPRGGHAKPTKPPFLLGSCIDESEDCWGPRTCSGAFDKVSQDAPVDRMLARSIAG